ncbi:MAG: succinate dehydrogenase cytochrome b subunit [Planctomycetes bacterium]|nr:succinate dehydrogenase cytochrome b subunit [Planctomycetota bacterium]
MAATKRGLAVLFGSTIGAKTVMAVTGLALILFLLTHMGGNLLIYFGPDVFNAYAKSLKSAGGGGLVWVARGGLLAMFATHVAMAFKLQLRNRAARPLGYAYEATVEASWASRYMILTGLLVLAFVVLHLAHYTVGVFNPDYLTWHDAEGRHDAYRMVVTAFSHPLVALSYVVAMVVLALHLVHGFQSLFRSLGNSHEQAREALSKASLGLALALAFGFCLAPVGVLLGWIQPVEVTQPAPGK